MDEVKTLALKLGLVETFVVNQESSLKSGSKNGMQGDSSSFDYIIVIDFESTCWNSKEPQSKWRQLPEIIEFPAVLMNMRTGVIEDQFHQYVMPVENPILSEFCTKLTGILQETVNSGIPLGTCIMLFNQWINKLSSEKNISFHKPSIHSKACTFVTWSDWDLAVCLQNETKRKNIRKPEILSQWIDLRLCYRKFYQRKPQGLKGAMAELGLPFKGREHSGIIDAKNTANLSYRMMKDGCKLLITSSTPLPSPQINTKRCPLGTLKNATTPVNREPQSLKIRTLKSAFLKTKTNHDTKWAKNGQDRQDIYTDEDKQATCMGLSKKSRQFNLTKQETVLASSTLNPSTPKRENLVNSSCKRTPPLCRCGRRASCKVANSPGPNQGRSFFCCPNPRRSLGMVSKSCSFFMWC